MRNISFSATIPQIRTHKKHVTRRGNKNGPTWKNLKVGDHLMACEKCQGLGKGGKIVRIGPIKVLEVSPEPVDEIIRRPFRRIPPPIEKQYHSYVFKSESTLEGFPGMLPEKFVTMFCEMNNCDPETEITRIMFDYVEEKKP